MCIEYIKVEHIVCIEHIEHIKVECKKAQPKEVVQAANTAALLGKRVILSNLGVMPALGLLPQVGCCCCLQCNHCSNGHGLLKKFWPFW